MRDSHNLILPTFDLTSCPSLAANEGGCEDAEDVVFVDGATRHDGGHVAATMEGEALAQGRARNCHSVMLALSDATNNADVV